MMAVSTGADAAAACTARGSTLSQAQTNYGRTCSQPQKDCDPSGGGWICSSEQIGGGKPGQPTPKPKPAPAPKPKPNPGNVCYGTGDTRDAATVAFQINCLGKKLADCDPYANNTAHVCADVWMDKGKIPGMGEPPAPGKPTPPPSGSPGGPGNLGKPTFEDNFNGNSVDTSKWNFRTGARMDGYGRKENVRVGGGKLIIDLKRENYGGKRFTHGGVISKQHRGYGYYETRAKLPAKKGWHSAFWSFGSKVHGNLFEIDGFEQDSHWRGHFSTNTHYYKPRKNMGAKYHDLGNRALDWNVYGYEWTPNEVRFYLNGKLLRTAKFPGPHKPQNIWLSSIAWDISGKGIAGNDTVQFDYVRFYARDY